MPETNDRLSTCFSTVFPDLPSNRIPSATQDSVKEWDSVAQITLLTLIDEEFGITTDMDEAQTLTSYGSLLEHIRRSVPDA